MRRLMLLLVLVFAGCDNYQAVPQHSLKPDMEGAYTSSTPERGRSSSAPLTRT